MINESIGQKAECDQCPWSGHEIELEQEIYNGKMFDVCPNCGEESISYLGYD